MWSPPSTHPGRHRLSDFHVACLALMLAFGTWLATGGVPSAHAQAPKREVTHTVQEGQAAWTIARAYGIGLDGLQAANPGVDLSRVRPGDTLRVVGATKKPRFRKRTGGKTTPASIRRARARAKKFGLGTRKAASKLLMGRADASWVRLAGGPGRFAGSLRWPVAKGWFVRGFGSGAGAYHQAIDIGGQVGWNVRAAADGVVGYAGNELKGFGNVVLVVHRGGWITLYGHNSVNRVVAGQKVKRGTVLAELGSTGKSRGPHVHFELLYGGKNCDPAPLIRPGIKQRKGGNRKVKRQTWRTPKRKPRSLRCYPRKKHPGHTA